MDEDLGQRAGLPLGDGTDPRNGGAGHVAHGVDALEFCREGPVVDGDPPVLDERRFLDHPRSAVHRDSEKEAVGQRPPVGQRRNLARRIEHGDL